MQHFLGILILTVYLASFSTGYRRFYNTPVNPNAGFNPLPVELPPPPVEVPVRYSVVTSSLEEGSALHWDATQGVLYFTDVKGQMLYRYDPATNVQKYIKFDSPVSMVIPIVSEKHKMVVGLGRDLVLLRWIWDSGNFTTTHIFSVDPRKPRSTWGMGRADSVGRIWAEVAVFADERHGVPASTLLYFLDTVNTCHVDSDLSEQYISVGGGGFAWSQDNKVLYYSSTSRQVKAFDFNVDSGSISNPRTVFDFADLPGSPSGITVDKDGNLWICSYGGSQIIQVNPNTGELLRQIKLPVKQVTSAVFGGPNLEDLYVSSARVDGSSLDGSVLKITDLKESGIPMYPANVLCKPCDDFGSFFFSWWCAVST